MDLSDKVTWSRYVQKENDSEEGEMTSFYRRLLKVMEYYKKDKSKNKLEQSE